MIAKILCLLGVHGPRWFSSTPHRTRSKAIGPFLRRCTRCGSVWKAQHDPLYREPCNWERIS